MVISKRSCNFPLFLCLLFLLIVWTLYHLFTNTCRHSISNLPPSDDMRSLKSSLHQQEPGNVDLDELRTDEMMSRVRQLSDKMNFLEQTAMKMGGKMTGMQATNSECYFISSLDKKSPEELLQPVDVLFPAFTEGKRKLVVLVTTMRSGSSFVGKMFAESDELLYMFEPFFLLEKLYPDQPWSYYDGMKQELLKSMLTCRFDSSQVSYRSVEAVSRGLPFPRDWSSTFTRLPFCPTKCQPANCPPIDVTIMNKGCLSRKVFMIKALRVFDLNMLKAVVESVRNIDNAAELHVLHLVRDPRGTIHSRLKIKGLLQRMYMYTHPNHQGEMPSTEKLVESNVEWLCRETLDQMEVGDQQPEWLKGKYLRVRFEDVANDAHGEMRKLYAHYGIKPTEKLDEWIRHYTKGSSVHGGVYGTWRKSEAVPFKWRNMLRLEQGKSLLRIIEEKCSKMMKALGYVPEMLPL